MGIATKYVIKKANGPHEAPDATLLDIETHFYKNLERKVFLVRGDSVGEDTSAEIWNRVVSFWNAVCFSHESVGDFLHDGYIRLSTDNSLLDDKMSELFHIRAGGSSRDTVYVKVGAKACSVADNTAFAAFDYLWEYIDRSIGTQLIREEGTLCQTWARVGYEWMLLGEVGGPSGLEG